MGFMNSFWRIRRSVRRFFKNKKPNCQIGDRIVYFVPGGSCYHYYDCCLDQSSKDVHEVKETKAIKMGLRLCKKCEKSFLEDQL